MRASELSPHSVGNKVILKPDRETGELCSASAASRGARPINVLASIQDAPLRLLGQDALPHKVCFSLYLSIPPLSQSLCLSLSLSLLLMANLPL